MGQAKKKRHCPAQGREITSAECGENRLSRYACPESCAFNPFAAVHYDELLETEDRLDRATVQEFGRQHAGDRALGDRLAAAAAENPFHGQHASIVWELFFARDGSGRSLAERWLARPDSGLKNDERVLLQGKARMRIALLEVRQVVDDTQFTATDLLDPTGTLIRFVDRSIAETSARFATLLAWIYPLPHFWRVSGTAITIADAAPFPPPEILAACVAHLGGPGPAEPEAVRRWLAQNFARIDQALFATGMERRNQLLAAIDATLGAATYDLVGTFAECEATLMSNPGLKRVPSTERDREQGFQSTFLWSDAEPSAGAKARQNVIGTVALGEKEIRLTGLGGARFDGLRSRFEKQLGPLVRFSRERRDDLGARMQVKEPPPHPELIVPRLLEKPTEYELSTPLLPDVPEGSAPEDQVAAMLRERQQLLLDESIPALGGLTPREAAQKPETRPQLIEWAKGLIRLHDAENLRTGRTADINGLMRELGLPELDVPPPPLRPIPDDTVDDDLEDDEFDEEEDDDLEAEDAEPTGRRVTEWSAPPLPNRPLTRKEVEARLQSALDAFETAGAALAELEQLDAEVLDVLDTLCTDEIAPEDMWVISVPLIQVWFALVPKGSVPPVRANAMEAQVKKTQATMRSLRGDPAKALKAVIDGCAQPNLLDAIASELFGLVEQQQPAGRTLKPGAVVHTVLLLQALINELDQAVRRKL